MDNADLAQSVDEMAWETLQRRIAASRHLEPLPEPARRTHCDDCGLPLADHRRVAGICVSCLEIREARARLGL